MLEEKHLFVLGDLVRFSAYPFDFGASEVAITHQNRTTKVKSGNTHMIPPVMVVIEIINEKKDVSPQLTMQNIRYNVAVSRVLCQWFSVERCEFQERWFDARLLIKSTDSSYSGDLNKEAFPYGFCVTLKTAIMSNRQTQERLKMVVEETLKKEGVNYSVIRTFDTLNYLPPKMLVLDVKDREKIPNRDKKKNLICRDISKWIVKCMWYDYKAGKYSEQYFTPEALIQCEKIADFELSAWDIHNKPQTL